ncbi:MAG: TVP38/TMEM64 family protein [Gemmatimonadaceae bacterium]
MSDSENMATSLEQHPLTIPPTDRPSTSAERARTRRSALMRIASLGLVILVLSVVAYRLGWFDVRRVTATIQGLQAGQNSFTVAAIFCVAYALLTAVGFPALPFTVAGGAIFGHLLGTLLSWTSAVVGMMLGYLLARTVGRESARKWISKRAVGAALTQSASFFTILRLRLIPVIPLSVVNFAAGLARTRFDVYVAASAIGALPATVVFVFLADSLVRGLQGAKTHAYWDVAIASALLLLISLVPVLAKKLKRA